MNIEYAVQKYVILANFNDVTTVMSCANNDCELLSVQALVLLTSKYTVNGLRAPDSAVPASLLYVCLPVIDVKALDDVRIPMPNLTRKVSGNRCNAGKEGKAF